MRFGLFGINIGVCASGQTAAGIGQAAEAAGFESAWTGEHVVLPDPQAPPSPEEFAGFPIGSDGNLVRWERIVEYFERLDRASDRVEVEELGKTTTNARQNAIPTRATQTLSLMCSHLKSPILENLITLSTQPAGKSRSRTQAFRTYCSNQASVFSHESFAASGLYRCPVSL